MTTMQIVSACICCGFIGLFAGVYVTTFMVGRIDPSSEELEIEKLELKLKKKRIENELKSL